MHLKSYIDTYLTKPPVLVGASLGGATCLHFAKMYPESVGGLVLIDAQANPEPLQQMPGFLSELGTSVLKSWPLRSLANNLSYFDKKNFATEDAIRVKDCCPPSSMKGRGLCCSSYIHHTYTILDSTGRPPAYLSVGVEVHHSQVHGVWRLYSGRPRKRHSTYDSGAVDIRGGRQNSPTGDL